MSHAFVVETSHDAADVVALKISCGVNSSGKDLGPQLSHSCMQAIQSRVRRSLPRRRRHPRGIQSRIPGNGAPDKGCMPALVGKLDAYRGDTSSPRGSATSD